MANPAVSKKSTNPADCYIGLRIRSRRLALGKTQEWLGDQLGLTFQQVQKYEKGTNRVGGGRMVQIASALQTDPSFFFEGAPSSDAGAPATVNGKRTSDDPLDGFLPFLDTYRTMCRAPQPAFRQILEDVRDLRFAA